MTTLEQMKKRAEKIASLPKDIGYSFADNKFHDYSGDRGSLIEFSHYILRLISALETAIKQRNEELLDNCHNTILTSEDIMKIYKEDEEKYNKEIESKLKGEA